MFPLGAVLFPGLPLLLHVFEPRYRALVRDCLGSDHEFGVVLITRWLGGGRRRPAGTGGDRRPDRGRQATARRALGPGHEGTPAHQRDAVATRGPLPLRHGSRRRRAQPSRTRLEVT